MKNLLLITTFILFSINAYTQKDGESIKKNAKGIIVEKGNFKNQKKDGVWQYYYHDGLPSLEANYIKGVLNGESKRYDLTGNVIANLNYVDGEITGKQTYYYSNGKVLSTGEMMNG